MAPGARAFVWFGSRNSKGAHAMPRFLLGFTLVEILTALAIGVVLIMLAVPGYRAWVADLEMREEVGRLTNAMSLARAESIKRNNRVNMCPSGDGAECADDGRWEQGWIVFSDTDHDGDHAASEAVIRVDPPSRPGFSIRGNRPIEDYVSYTAFGSTRMANGALQMGTFTICRSGDKAVDVVLANGGRVRVVRTGTPCP
jgi:type IV fimbrial biogenesis protein FimT